ncbi:hypothetical protein [Synechococcus sp. PCC 6312]|uniref:hypothetical protein n=1 Tax=Synechococcus sp. (strain ATCC 27167 / PCC 6312) TaxID=195253 RepID=UPI0012EA42D7|nr:hypothetical protein [Synechococcus sp. PCC 6312]
MPRLVGKQSNGNWFAGITLILTIAALGYLEYAGAINLITGIGLDNKLNDQPQQQLNP